LLGLIGRLSGGVLSLLGGSLRGLLDLLLGLLSGLLGLVLYSGILGRLIYGALKLGVGVGHLLDLGLRILGKLLHEAFELGAVALHPALYPAHRSREEVLGLLQGLILRLLLEILRLFAHFFSSLLWGSCSSVFLPRYPGSDFTHLYPSLPVLCPNYSKNRDRC
jgi:hypothetical protein